MFIILKGYNLIDKFLMQLDKIYFIFKREVY